MDSKYSAIGVPNGVKKINNLKRKKNSLNTSDIKKLKLTIQNHSAAVQQSESNGDSSETKVQNNEKQSSENILESRKQLPVYMVKGR